VGLAPRLPHLEPFVGSITVELEAKTVALTTRMAGAGDQPPADVLPAPRDHSEGAVPQGRSPDRLRDRRSLEVHRRTTAPTPWRYGA
jgi:hypothetical protein